MSSDDEKMRSSLPPPNNETLPFRLAVYTADGLEKQPLATVKLTREENNGWTVSLKADSEEKLQPLKPIINAFAQKRAAKLDITSEDAPSVALADELRAAGYIVEELPVGDYLLGIEIDLKTGRMVASNTALHGLVPKEFPYARRMMESITSALNGQFDVLVKQIEGYIADEEHTEAVATIRSFIESGKPALSPTSQFLNAINLIDVSRLSTDDRQLVREIRLEVSNRLGRLDVAAPEAKALLEEDANLAPKRRAILKMTAVLGTNSAPETAISTLKDLLKEPSDLDAAGRGWAWRNLSLLYGEDHPDFLQASRSSADAFLEAGNKEEAARSLMGAVNFHMKEEPIKAVKSLGEMSDLFTQEGLTNRYLKGSIHHARATRLSMLHRHEESYADALIAVNLSRGLLSAEEAFVSSLHLAAIEAQYIGKNDEAEAFEKEAKQLTEKAELKHFQYGERVAELFESYDNVKAKALAKEAEASGDIDIFVGVQLAIANKETSFSKEDRLRLLEETLKRAESDKRAHSMIEPTQRSIAELLHKSSDFDRAAIWHRKILENSPVDSHAVQGLVDCLWNLKRWDQAAVFLRRQTTLNENKPGLWYALGKSLYEAKNMNEAATALLKSQTIIDDNPDLRTTRPDIEALEKNTKELLAKAIKSGGIIQNPFTLPVQASPLTLDEFEAALGDFAKVTSSDRMIFWRKSEKDHEWVSSPEKLAQGNLNIFLNGRFGNKIETIKELAVGAGRIDIYVKLRGGASVVVELKMCGYRYSGPYAASGEDQIVHYMDNKETSVGYLVVFDARLTNNGEKLLSGSTGHHTIKEISIDVTPRVTKRKPSKPKPRK